VDGLWEASMDGWTDFAGARQFLAVTQAAGWSMCLEVNGFIGVTEALIIPVSRGRRLVSHYRNVDAVDRFYLASTWSTTAM
jgi:hypothetical protein